MLNILQFARARCTFGRRLRCERIPPRVRSHVAILLSLEFALQIEDARDCSSSHKATSFVGVLIGGMVVPSRAPTLLYLPGRTFGRRLG